MVNFPVKENAVGMSMRQIGWEKRKRVKEATVATVTATAGFNLLLDSFNLLSLFFSFFPLASSNGYRIGLREKI